MCTRILQVETNHGKRPLVVELDTPEGKEKLWDLLKVAEQSKHFMSN